MENSQIVENRNQLINHVELFNNFEGNQVVEFLL